ncbi:AAA family ATPase [Clostridium felsineum]|uniref:Uncharacterized protein n=1 Tax=Clostridium felsineum TaxID=36839 RepID=A0A1S8KY84_9CLOT|nr:AAA family ATPase [Clostridium felsineum]URZ05953.1 hypothetical protein CLROS_012850 [Clostridium felsineum]URZ10990.1 hypothetical protein CROST_017060 [Clostridium felsineum]
MKNIIIYYGPRKEYNKLLPSKKTTLMEFINADDSRRKEIIFKQTDKNEMEKSISSNKPYIDNLVAYSASYSNITEGALQDFVSILNCYDIQYLYLQNPPMQIKQQLKQTFFNIIDIKRYNYKLLSNTMFKKINDTFSNNIIGQDKVKERLLIALYPLLNKSKKNKPVVLMFYGDSGVGKTETAKFIGKILGQKIFKKQFSMFHSTEFSNYLFGGNHSQSCFSKDLLERESNVILLDEFDKADPVFYSAFYELFDEGVFQDKNYKLELYNTIIICTSNYHSEDEMKKYLGDAIFYRFDKVIEFQKLSLESLNKIIDITVENKYKKLKVCDRNKVNIKNIRELMHNNVSRFNNVRQINNIVEEFIDIDLVKNLLNKE